MGDAAELPPLMGALDDPVFTLAEAAAIVRLPADDLDAERRAGRVAYIKARGRTLFLRSDLAAYLSDRRTRCRDRDEPTGRAKSANGGQPNTPSEAEPESPTTGVGTIEPPLRSDGIALTPLTALAAARAASQKLANGSRSGSKRKPARSRRHAASSP